VIANPFLVIRKEQAGLSSCLNLENGPLVVLVSEADFLSAAFEGRNLRAVVRVEVSCFMSMGKFQVTSLLFFKLFF